MSLSLIRKILATVLALAPAAACGQDLSTAIRLNQVGFFQSGSKGAVVVDPPTNQFQIMTADGSAVVFEGTMGSARTWVSSQEHVRLADFSGLTAPGSYVFVVPGLGHSYAFEVGVEPMEDVVRGAVKAFYFQRASAKLWPQWAGVWTRAAGHPDTQVRVHASAATTARPEGTFISAPKGWYDAGDYNKYVVNSGIATGQLLMLYERFPAYFGALGTNIPESGNGVPDLLDEILWNLRWMIAMQDPDDGGVYHKLTTPNFEGMVMPAQAAQARYVVQKSTSAALNLAAVAAIGARVVAPLEDRLPGLADSLLQTAFSAWNWAQNDPEVRYSQSAMNLAFDPDVNTGEYGDSNFRDEFRWAAVELFLTTGRDSFLVSYPPDVESTLTVPGWSSVESLGLASLSLHRKSAAALIDTVALRASLQRIVNQLVEGRRNNPYGVGIGNATGDFFWGSNSYAANQGFLAMVAYEWARDGRYLEFASANLDYLLGRNATGYSFMTGFGDLTPMHPHHRPSEADGVSRPVPGLLVGGPNAGRQDGCTYPYPQNQPARSYVDHVCSYASNEIAINWQASLAFLAGSLAATLSPGGLPVSIHRERPTGSPVGSRLDVWPNPTHDTARVRVVLEKAGSARIALVDALGRTVWEVLPGSRRPAGSFEARIDTSRLAPGLYWLRLVAGGEVRSRGLAVLR